MSAASVLDTLCSATSSISSTRSVVQNDVYASCHSGCAAPAGDSPGPSDANASRSVCHSAASDAAASCACTAAVALQLTSATVPRMTAMKGRLLPGGSSRVPRSVRNICIAKHSADRMLSRSPAGRAAGRAQARARRGGGMCEE
jgi:hypothetical protein